MPDKPRAFLIRNFPDGLKRDLKRISINLTEQTGEYVSVTRLIIEVMLKWVEEYRGGINVH